MKGSTHQSEIGRLRSVAVKHIRDAWGGQLQIDAQWKDLGYCGRPDLERALVEYENLLRLFEELEIETHFFPADSRTGLDSIYARDSSVVSDRGVVLGNMGKRQRRGEPEAVRAGFAQMGVPVLGAITGRGLLEGGDVVWLDEQTLAVGQGYRTNSEGIRQLRELLGNSLRELLVVPLPHWRGSDDVFHLMSMVSPIDRDLALVYSPLLPVPFRQTLIERGIRLIEVPEEEFDTMAGNVLTVAPRRCIMLTGNPRTQARLEAAGAEVLTFEGEEISRKGYGGPTCLTRPLLRSVGTALDLPGVPATAGV